MKPVLFLVVCAGFSWAQQPRISNAKLDARAVASGLEREVQSIAAAQNGPAWVGYAVRAVPGQHQMCCYSSFEDGAGNRCCRGCALEGARAGTAVSGASGPIPLEGAGDIFVLFRIENHTVDRIRTFSADCELDAGGLPVHWLTGVPAAESVSFLTRFAREAGDEGRGAHRRSEPAISAIALHADPAADQALETFVTPGQPESITGKGHFLAG